MNVEESQECLDKAYKLFSLGNLEEGILYLRKLVSKHSEVPAFWVILGDKLAESGDAAEAEIAFSEAIRLNPKQTMAYLGLGSLCADQKRKEEAKFYFEKAKHIEPNNELVLAALDDFIKFGKVQ